ncbi:hypothetical protein J3R30DRAFT_3419753 [Lentinula aciculospora]|uniref:NADH dehydrogenase [ubiquinone] 1 alpha subcomplex subunit n=1 Tax=Lentinula aciculospora TaxID=153920 RepID=A0A9W9DXY7_9AGAR|nr:hypothetical protein J3R30DRAFT_3419753 [Lentinula aciculospora]
MSKSSLIRKIWRRIWRPTGFVGRDLEGNSYYEWSNPLKSAGYARPKRSVKYRNPDDMWNYIGGSNRLPIQWAAWLAHTRSNPPSIQELQMDLARQQHVQQNAALIEASFQQERAQLRIQGGTSPDIISNSSDIRPNQIQKPSSTSAISSASSPSTSSVPVPALYSKVIPTPEPSSRVQGSGSSLPKTGSDEYQPESWTPKLRIRQG